MVGGEGEVSSDLKFLLDLLEMKKRLEEASSDPTQLEYVKEMVHDWIDELTYAPEKEEK